MARSFQADFAKTDETALDLFSRARSVPLDCPAIPFMTASVPGGFPSGSVVEVCGGGGVGKTDLIVQLVAQCILPRVHMGFRVGGRTAPVTWIDADLTFPLARLLVILEMRFLDAVEETAVERGAANEDEMFAWRDEWTRDFDPISFCESCLARLTIIRPSNRLELLATLRQLRNGGGTSAASPPAALVIDSMVAFQGLERTRRGSLPSLYSYMARMVSSFVEATNAVVLVSKPSLFTRHQNKTGSGAPGSAKKTPRRGHGLLTPPPHEEYLPPAWRALVSHRVEIWSLGRYTPSGFQAALAASSRSTGGGDESDEIDHRPLRDENDDNDAEHEGEEEEEEESVLYAVALTMPYTSEPFVAEISDVGMLAFLDT